MDTHPQSQSDTGGGNHEYLTRRERRQLARAQHVTGAGRSRAGRRLLLWGGGLAVLALIIWGMVTLSANTSVPSGNGTLSGAVTEADHISGPASASVTLVEYSDFQCPACAAFRSVVKTALNEPALKDKIRFVYRSFPLTGIHANAELAARAAEAAALQGKFWEMHDALFEGQSSWSGLSGSGAREVFRGYATGIGLDVNAFTSDIESDAVSDSVRAQSDSGKRSGVNSTPTFFINGKQMSQPKSYEEFRQFLIDATNANP